MTWDIPWVSQDQLCPPPNFLCTPSPLAGGAVWEAEKALALCKRFSAVTKTSLCYQHYSHPKSKTQHCTNSIPAETRTSTLGILTSQPQEAVIIINARFQSNLTYARSPVLHFLHNRSPRNGMTLSLTKEWTPYFKLSCLGLFSVSISKCIILQIKLCAKLLFSACSVTKPEEEHFSCP